MQRIFSQFGEWSLCNWYECRGCDSPFQFKDRLSVESWLRSFKADQSSMDGLRRIVRQQGDDLDLSRMGDDQIIARVVSLIDCGRLRVCGKIQGGDGVAKKESIDPRDRIEEERIIRSLRAKDQDFMFEGRILRIIRVDQWFNIREDERYQIIPRDEAQKIFEKMAAVPALPETEKIALQEAAPLVPDTSRRQIDSGILLLRKILRGGASKTSSEAAITPSQLAKFREEQQRRASKISAEAAITPPQPARPEEKKQHWIEIELVGEDGAGIPDEAYLIVTPDNQEFKGKTDAHGQARLDGIVAGQCKICFTNLDKDTWHAA